METEPLDRAMRLLEQANAGLDAQRCSRVEAERLLRFYSRIERLAAFGKAAVSARLGNPTELARVSGTSVGAARKTIETGRRFGADPRLAEAARCGEVSLDQAALIARTTAVAPESMDDLLSVARNESFHVLEDRARAVRLQAEDRSTLGDRQHQARRLRHWVGEMGMVCIEAALEPHIGAPIVHRLDREARRIARRAPGDEPFERCLADALPAIATGSDGPRGRTEMVVLVSHEITQRGWRDVRDGEHCKIPGIGPIDPRVAHSIAGDAFLNALFFDGEDLRHFTRWTRNLPPPVRIALQLGDPPDFDGPRCIDCGNRFHLEVDHLQALADGGATSVANTGGRCLPCHRNKTAADTRAALLRRPTNPHRPGTLQTRQPQPRAP
ncbi:MAG: HNH endonuclease [Actinobacteria bacterium]|nr:HNH endonuclease [Actinomycetota bacterium]